MAGNILKQTFFQVQQILDKVNPHLLNDLSVSATTYYGDGSNLTGIATEHNELPDLQGGETDQYYHLTSDEYSHVSGSSLNLKAMQNVGIDQRNPILPTDIVIDPVNNTISVATLGGLPISASNPIRYYTDGNGIVTEHLLTTSPTASFSNTTGIWYVHFDVNSQLIVTQTPWSDFNVIVTLYRFYLNATKPDATKIVVRAFEGHLNVMTAEVHSLFHADGTRWLRGFDIVSNILTASAGVPTVAPNIDGRNTVISLTTGTNSDDGLNYTVTNTQTPTGSFQQDMGILTAGSLNSTNSGLFKIRTNNVSGVLDFFDATRFPFKFNATTNVPQYIPLNGTPVDIPDSRWFVYYAYALQDDKVGEAIKLVSAQSDFSAYSLAQNHSWEELQSLYATLNDKEIRPLYKVIFYTKQTTGNAYDVACKYSGIVNIINIRTAVVSSVSAGSSGTVLASNVIVTPPLGYVSTNAQSLFNEMDGVIDNKLSLTGGTLTGPLSGTSISATTFYGDGSNLTGIVTTHNNLNGLQGGTAGEYYHLTQAEYSQLSGNTNLDSRYVNISGDTMTGALYVPLLSAETYSGITTSKVVNTSNLTGATVTDVFNSSVAVETDSILNSDYIYGYSIGTGNIVVPWGAIETGLTSAYDSRYVNITGDTITGTLYSTSLSASTLSGNGATITGLDHNTVITGKQGGTTGQYYHLTSTEYSNISGNTLDSTYNKITTFNTHTGDTTIHYAKSSINLSDLASTAHTHPLSDITEFVDPRIYYANDYAELVSICENIPTSVEEATIYILEPQLILLGFGATLNVHTPKLNIIAPAKDIFQSTEWNIYNTSSTSDVTIFFDGIIKYLSNEPNYINISGDTNTVDLYIKGIDGSSDPANTLEGTFTYNYSKNVTLISGMTQYDMWFPYTDIISLDNRVTDLEGEIFYSTGYTSGYNIIESKITRQGDVMITAYVTFSKNDSGSMVLLPQMDDVYIHFDSFKAVFLGADSGQTGSQYINGLITLPRFIGEGTQLSQSVDASIVGEQYVYYPNTTGSVQYLISNNKRIDMSTGNLILNYSNTQTDTANRAWYAVQLRGTASVKSSNWVTI